MVKISRHWAQCVAPSPPPLCVATILWRSCASGIRRFCVTSFRWYHVEGETDGRGWGWGECSLLATRHNGFVHFDTKHSERRGRDLCSVRAFFAGARLDVVTLWERASNRASCRALVLLFAMLVVRRLENPAHLLKCKL